MDAAISERKCFNKLMHRHATLGLRKTYRVRRVCSCVSSACYCNCLNNLFNERLCFTHAVLTD